MGAAWHGLFELYHVTLAFSYCALIACWLTFRQEAYSFHRLKSKTLTWNSTPFATFRRNRQIWGKLLVLLCGLLFGYRISWHVFIGSLQRNDILCLLLLLLAGAYGYSVLGRKYRVTNAESIAVHASMLFAVVSCSV